MMRFCIIGSGYDVLMTLGLVNHTNHQFFCVIDSKHGSRSQRSWEFGVERLYQTIAYVLKLGVQKIIVPPIYELMLRNDMCVVPLFQTYLLKYVLPRSRVGKIGILADHYDTPIIQGYIQDVCRSYRLTNYQSATKTFHRPFAYWTKDVSLWGDFLKRAIPRHWMLRSYIKHDVRYFQDANVDILIPTSYTHFYREKVLRHHLNFKKIRRLPKSVIQEIIPELIGVGDDYTCQLYANDDVSYMITSYPRKGYITKGAKLSEVVYIQW